LILAGICYLFKSLSRKGARIYTHRAARTHDRPDISHYKILEKLGGSAWESSIKPEDLKLKRRWPFKFSQNDFPFMVRNGSGFTLEAQSASALNHPNICTVYEIDEANDETFIVMEYLMETPCGNGSEKSGEETEGYRKLGRKESLDIATQVAEGVEKHTRRE